jgi:hypothetical protein
MGERRYFKAHKGNCLQCCLCYLLDVNPDEVLDVSSMPEKFHSEWFQFVNEYLYTNYEKVLVPMAEGHMPSPEGLAVLESMDGSSTHVVVIDENDKILWDPGTTEQIYGKTLVRLALL